MLLIFLSAFEPQSEHVAARPDVLSALWVPSGVRNHACLQNYHSCQPAGTNILQKSTDKEGIHSRLSASGTWIRIYMQVYNATWPIFPG